MSCAGALPDSIIMQRSFETLAAGIQSGAIQVPK